MEQAGLRGHIGEGAVAVVAIELVLAVVSDEEIFEPVVVVVAHADAGGPPGPLRSNWGQAGLGGHVLESAVAIVVIETITRSGRDAIEFASTKNEDVHPAVIVIV